MIIMTPNQELLTDYLIALKMPLADRMYIVAILWEEEATLEMLQYIAKTKESDLVKLSSIALEISKKYESHEE